VRLVDGLLDPPLVEIITAEPNHLTSLRKPAQPVENMAGDGVEPVMAEIFTKRICAAVEPLAVD
jgi:hypothetical protein